MKKLLSILILFSLFTNSYGQLYDLIVTMESDSLACRIDSITDTHIYFEMKNNYNWIHTNLNKERITEYKKNVIDKKSVVFETGSSYFSTYSPSKIRNFIHIDGGTGIFWATLSLNYEGILWDKSETVELRYRTGLLLVSFEGTEGALGVPLNLTLLVGRQKHYFELTAGYSQMFVFKGSADMNMYAFGIVDIGYRYEPKNGGFLFRVKAGSGGFGVGAGYSF